MTRPRWSRSILENGSLADPEGSGEIGIDDVNPTVSSFIRRMSVVAGNASVGYQNLDGPPGLFDRRERRHSPGRCRSHHR